MASLILAMGALERSQPAGDVLSQRETSERDQYLLATETRRARQTDGAAMQASDATEDCFEDTQSSEDDNGVCRSSSRSEKDKLLSSRDTSVVAPPGSLCSSSRWSRLN